MSGSNQGPLQDLLARARGRMEYGDVDGAIADFTEAIRDYPRSALPYILRGDARMLKRTLDDAIADYTAAILIDPHDAGIYRRRARAYQKYGWARQAKRDFEKAKSLGSSGAWRAITKVGSAVRGLFGK